MPRGMFGREDAVRRQLAQAEEIGVSHVWVGNLGALALAQETDMFIHGGFSLNIFNTASVEWCEDNGLSDVELSFELTAEQARRIGRKASPGPDRLRPPAADAHPELSQQERGGLLRLRGGLLLKGIGKGFPFR